jgi:hypothetical protein
MSLGEQAKYTLVVWRGDTGLLQENREEVCTCQVGLQVSWEDEQVIRPFPES